MGLLSTQGHWCPPRRPLPCVAPCPLRPTLSAVSHPAVHAASGPKAERDQPQRGADEALRAAAGQGRAGSHPLQHHRVPGQDWLLPQCHCECPAHVAGVLSVSQPQPPGPGPLVWGLSPPPHTQTQALGAPVPMSEGQSKLCQVTHPVGVSGTWVCLPPQGL